MNGDGAASSAISPFIPRLKVMRHRSDARGVSLRCQTAGVEAVGAESARVGAAGNHTVTVVPSRKRLSIFKLP